MIKSSVLGLAFSVLIKGYKINNLPYKSLNQTKHFNNGVVTPNLSYNKIQINRMSYMKIYRLY